LRHRPWFLVQIEDLMRLEGEVAQQGLAGIDAARLRASSARVSPTRAWPTGRHRRRRACARCARRSASSPVYKRVDSCAAEFATSTAYMYSTYEEECEAAPTKRDKIIVLGGGPNRIGQGIEFDYCCVHAALALREDGFETIMVNCNPETVSTDYDTSDRLYFEPLTLEDVLEIVDKEQPKGVIVQYGGQTPLKLARALEAAGVPIIGTSPDSIDLAEDRERFQQMIQTLGLKQPPNRTARTPKRRWRWRARSAIRWWCVRATCSAAARWKWSIPMPTCALHDARRCGVQRFAGAARPLPRQRRGVDVDCIVRRAGEVLIGGIMEHIEEAGVHSGDSSCSLPPYSLSPEVQDRLRDQVRAMARALKVIGLMNTQFAIQGDTIYVLEVNPRASRTVPFVAKATGMALAKIAARCMVGNPARTGRDARDRAGVLLGQGSDLPVR
jgi:carbamoyl-phosphate synthase large subunit